MSDEAALFNEWWMREGDPHSDGAKFAAWNGWLARANLVEREVAKLRAEIIRLREKVLTMPSVCDEDTPRSRIGKNRDKS